MNAEQLKTQVARAALKYVESGEVVGVGSGSTVNCFIDALADIKHKIDGAVAASEVSAARLREHGIRVLELNQVGKLRVYVDGADEATKHLHLIKGGGGALTREKIIAEASERFICIADVGKLKTVLGEFPLPVEVIPMAQSLVGRKLVALGAQPKLRDGFTTDNGNIILDAHNLAIPNPPEMEQTVNQMPGVVTVGLFARRGADVLLLADAAGIKTLQT